MIKYLFLLLNFISFLLIDLFFGEVNVTINAPSEAVAGSSFVVEVTITKSNLDGFARYQQEFPIGYTATMVNSFNGDATFKDQKLKIIWYKIPADSIFTIVYNVKVDSTAEGPLNLSGTFNYILENEVKTFSIPAKTIIIRPQGYIADNNQNNNNQNQSQGIDTTNQQTNNNVVTNNSFPANEVFCYRQIVRESNEIKVHLLVNTADLSKDKFAKIQESIPAGFTASNIESKDGIFSFKDNNVKFLWMALPAQSQFEVSYKLTSTAPSSDIPDITGNFSYIENDATKLKTIENRDFLKGALIASNNQNQNQNQQQNTDQNTQNNQSDQVNNQNQNQTNNQINNNQIANNQNNQNNNQVIPTPETGVRYKVQIAAGHTPVNPKYYFKKFSVSENVQMELHEGWHKYTIGSFTIYKDARDRRVQVWQNTPIHDAFVSAYNNGARITVQEALMVANQKWYQ